MKGITKILKGLLRTKTAVPTKVGNAWTSGEIKAYRVGGTVFLKFSGAHINALTQRTTIATLPEGYMFKQRRSWHLVSSLHVK